MTKYVIFENQLEAMQLSFKASKQTNGRVSFKWSYLVNNDKTKSCLILEYKADYIDMDGSLIHPNCSYNEFMDKYENTTYTIADILDETWNNNFKI